jgi:hypothetical protein
MNNNAIWKFEFPIKGEFLVEMPGRVRVLHADTHQAKVATVAHLWAVVEPGQPTKKHRFRLFGTGQPIDQDMLRRMIPVSTFHTGSMTFHLFSVPL